MTILLQTADAGATWKASETSMFGQISRLSLSADGRGLGWVEFQDDFEWPSEVFGSEWQSGKSTRVFRRKDRAVTDVAVIPGGPAYLAAVEPSGELLRGPIPGKLKVLRSTEFKDWIEIPTDYRAVATRGTAAFGRRRGRVA